ncbi:MAG: S-methyl-5-thioribose-1-phosphate isomerase [Thermotogae bacterium]|nr:S-methyl-5-thioribose-1-phosphate isomerase [Thermotogota bacterium]
MVETLKWNGETLKLIDQRKLPNELVFVTCKNHNDVAEAINKMIVRGAPAIGVSAAYGYVLGIKEYVKGENGDIEEYMKGVYNTLIIARPTAVNLKWAVNRMTRVFEKNLNKPLDVIIEKLEKEANDMAKEDIETNKKMGRNGAELLPERCTVLTHCNAGALATVGYGTALGVIRAAVEMGKEIKVYADETRPYLQGARLTVWELMEDNIDVTLITDNMAGWVMKQGKIDAVLVGADRISANGDVANKIGTYSLAVLAKHHNIPLYVVAPFSSIDMNIASGKDIPIEERPTEEITKIKGVEIAPKGVKAYNPAFDVTDNEFVTAIITERGVIRQPYSVNLS